MKLHLGCGEVYLEGYRNIDQPAEAHAVQRKIVADEQADLTGLRYPAGSIEEVRLHHVFEHFSRPVAMALAASWGSWLRPGGVLRIEVPDFERTARSALRTFASRRRRFIGIRHLFGSREAEWAVHREGWTQESLGEVFRLCGVEVQGATRTRWLHTYNITVVGARSSAALDRKRVEASVEKWFGNYLLDDSATELRLLEVWMDAYRLQTDRSWPPATPPP